MSAASEALADRIRALLDYRPGITEQKMFGGFAFMLNGNMLVGGMGNGDLLVRAGPDRRDEALARPGASQAMMKDRAMTGFIAVADEGMETDAALADWIATTTPRPDFRSELAVKMRGASYGDRAALLANVAELVADHRTRLAHYESLATRDYPDPDRLEGRDLDTYLVLRGGILQETFWITWLTEYLEAHE